MRAASGWVSATILALITAILVLIGVIFTKVYPIKNYMILGLDLQGGVNMVLQAEEGASPEAVRAAMQVIQRRVDALGLSEPVIQQEGNDRIVVQLAGLDDPDKAREVVGRTASLKFVGPDNSVVLTGEDVAEAGVASTGTGGYVVTLKLKGEGPDKFAEATEKFLYQQIAIMLDDEVISAPVVQNVITTGEAQITGDFTVEEASELAGLINGGALPVNLEVVENRVVSATLGTDSLIRSARAGVIGMIAVVLFMVLLYRIPGLMACLALTLYAYLTMGFLVAVRATFSLPAIAGLLLSIGMAVDANVIIFERIKEELRNGKGLRSGIHAGFHRAYAAVIDSNVTTIIAGAILWFLGTGGVKGFALTLIVGNVLSLFTAITVTRWLINLCVATGWFGKNLFGIREVAQ